jgi:hypothetical protein
MDAIVKSARESSEVIENKATKEDGAGIRRWDTGLTGPAHWMIVNTLTTCLLRR